MEISPPARLEVMRLKPFGPRDIRARRVDDSILLTASALLGLLDCEVVWADALRAIVSRHSIETSIVRISLVGFITNHLSPSVFRKCVSNRVNLVTRVADKKEPVPQIGYALFWCEEFGTIMPPNRFAAVFAARLATRLPHPRMAVIEGV